MSTQNSLLKDQAVKPNEFEAHAIKTGLIFLANTGNEINIVSVVKVKPVLSDVPTPRKHHTTAQQDCCLVLSLAPSSSCETTAVVY